MAGEAGLARRVLELLDQARLADPGLAAHVDGLPAPARAAVGEGRAELAQLGVAARRAAGGPGRRAQRRAAATPAPARRSPSPRAAPAPRSRAGRQARAAPRPRPGSRPARAASVRREARFTESPVTVYSRCARAAGAAGDDLAAGDADVHVQVAAGLGRERRHGVADGQRGPHRPLGVVAVGDRRAEHRHDAVADVLVDPAAVLLDEAVGELEEARRAARAPPPRRARGSARCSRRGRRRAPSPAAARPRLGRGRRASAERSAPARSAAIASSSLRRWPTAATPSSFRSSAVSLGRTSASTSLSRNACSYWLKPEPAQPSRDVHLRPPIGHVASAGAVYPKPCRADTTDGPALLWRRVHWSCPVRR